MKRNLSIARSGLCAIAMAGLMASCGDAQETKPAVKAKTEAKAKKDGAETRTLKIAFVQIDTLTNQYTYYQEMMKKMEKKQSEAEATAAQKEKNFANQYQALMQKAQSGSMNQEQYEQEQLRLQKLQEEIRKFEENLSIKLQEETAEATMAITDTIKSFMSSYAKEKGFDFILCKGSGIDQVLYADDTYDVTDEVVAALNKRHKKNEK